MEKKKIILFVLMVLPFFISAQSLVNNGAAIILQNGSAIKLKGDYINQQNGRIKNEGTINLDGDWKQNSISSVFLPVTGGQVKITGLITHVIGGSYYPFFPSLKLETDVYLEASTYIGNYLDIDIGTLRLANNDLVILPGATIFGGGEAHFIKTDGTGTLQMSVGSSPVIFPVGTLASFAPISLSTNSTTDNFKVNVKEGVLSNGNSGSSIPEIEDCVNLTWNVEPETPSTADYNVIVQWNANDEGLSFNRNISAIGIYHTGSWNGNIVSAATGINPYEQSLSNISHPGNFAVGDTESPMVIILNLILDVKAFLEGAFVGVEMQTSLNDNGYIPLSQPYNTTPWNYTGTESVASIPNNQVLDWVLIEGRDAPNAASATESTSFARQAAFLLKDGSVVGLDGFSKPEFTTFLTPQLFILIWHRNHLGIMSAIPLTLEGGFYNYDFTASASQAYLSGQINLGGGNYGMYAGDADGNGNINSADISSKWDLQAGKSGYHTADMDMNGQVKNQDKNDVWLPNNTLTDQVPD